MIISSINRFTQKHGPLVFTLILIIIAIPFVFYGYLKPDNGPTGQIEIPDVIGSCMGEDVTPQEAGIALNRPVEEVRGALKSRLENLAILRTAEKEGLGDVTNKELTAELVKHQYASVYTTDGKFDFSKYSKLPEQMRVGLEKQITEQIITTRLQNRIQESAAAKVTDKEIRDTFNKENITYAISAVSIDRNDLIKDIKIEDAEVKAKYEETKERYRVPEKTVLSVVKFEGKEFAEKATATDDEVKAYYEKNGAEKYNKDKVKASHILVKVEKDATPEVKAEKKKEIEAILAKIKAGEKLADLAKDNSECPSKDKKGDLGWFGKGQMVKPFEEKAFAMKKGEVSDIVETDFGFHIIELTDTPKSFDELKEEIAKTLKEEKITQLTGSAAVTFANNAYDFLEKNGESSANFAKFVKTSGRTAFTTEPFVPGGYAAVKGIPSRKFANDVKGLSADAPLSEAIAGNGNTYYVAYFLKTTPSEVLPYEKATDAQKSITTQLKRDKALVLAEEKAKKVYADTKAAIDAGKKFADIAKSLNFKDIEDFKAKEYPQGLQAGGDVKKQLASKKADELFEPVKGYGGYDVVYVRAITPATDADFEKGKAETENKLKNTAKNKAWAAERKKIIANANISLVAPWAEEKKEETAK